MKNPEVDDVFEIKYSVKEGESTYYPFTQNFPEKVLQSVIPTEHQNDGLSIRLTGCFFLLL